MTDPLNIIFDDFGVITWWYDRTQLFIYFTRALFNKYSVGMTYHWICIIYLFLSESSPIMTSELLIMSNKGKNALKYDQSIRKVLLDLI